MTLVTATLRPTMLHRTRLAIGVATVLLTACGGGGSSDPAPPQDTPGQQNPFEPVSGDEPEQPGNDGTPDQTEQPGQQSPPPAPQPDPPPAPTPNPPATTPDGPQLNTGDDLVVVADPTDNDCTGLIQRAIELYGEPNSREDVTDETAAGTVNSAVIGWFGIETIVIFASGPAVNGCEAIYAYGGPAIQVPAITAPPGATDGPPALPEVSAISPTFSGVALSNVIEVNGSLPASQQPSVGGFDSTSPEWERSLANPGPVGNGTGGCFTFLGNMIGDRGVPEESTPDGSSPMTWWYLTQGYAVTFVNTATDCSAEDYRFSPTGASSASPEADLSVEPPEPVSVLASVSSGDPDCRFTLQALRNTQGEPATETVLPAGETENGYVQTVLTYPLVGQIYTLEQATDQDACNVYVSLPG